jgi:hypothetical protein
MIQGVSLQVALSNATTNAFTTPSPFLGQVPNAAAAPVGVTPGSALPAIAPQTNTLHLNGFRGRPVRRYQIQLALGLFNQEKLIPTKFMASQLAIEITLENAAACMYYQPSTIWGTQPTGVTNFSLGTPAVSPPSYTVRNVNIIPEILEFDSSYDENFLRGLQNGGVPIKFSTWNNFRYSQNGVGSLNLQIQERSRSVKSIFVLQRRDPSTFSTDSGASFFNTGSLGTANDAASTLQEFQFRIGGRYFPAQPVQCSTTVGGTIPNGGCEAYVELGKALNTLGDYRLHSNCTVNNWAVNPLGLDPALGTAHTLLSEYDYDYQTIRHKATGSMVVAAAALPVPLTGTNGSIWTTAGNLGSSCFVMAIDLETSNGLEISGLNAEEQSDISLIARYSATQAAGFVFDVFTHIDSMIVLRENNVLELIE